MHYHPYILRQAAAMIERDWFMRMISMLTTMLAKIIFYKSKKDYPQALLELQTTSKTLLGIDRNLLKQLSADQIMQMFGSDLSVAVPKSYVAATLLKEEADILALMGEEEESYQTYAGALALLLGTLEQGGEPVEPRHIELIDEILEKLRELTIPPEILEKVFRYQERMGRYDKAENVLYEILQVKPEFTSEGVLFYERLLKKTDEELVKGNLPKDEVLEGMNEMKK